MATIRDVVAENEWLSGLCPLHLEAVAEHGQETELEPRSAIVREDDPANSFFLMRHGRVALQLGVPGRGAVVIETLGPGDVLGTSWIVPPYRWHTTAVAVEPTAAVVFDGSALRRRCDEDPVLGYALTRRFMRLLDDQLRIARVRLLELYGYGHAP